jgi:hypothetical protein
LQPYGNLFQAVVEEVLGDGGRFCRTLPNPRRNRVEETLISSLIEAEREWRTASSPMSKC